jgi:hypothetical protein
MRTRESADAAEKRYLDDVARVFVLWARDGCSGNLREAVDILRERHGAAAEACHVEVPDAGAR